MKRPQPPENLLGLDPEFDPIDFEPAPDLRKWILETFVYEDGPLYNPEHDHIQYFERDFFAVLWASSAFVKAEKYVLGQCERISINAGGWKKARQELQLQNWFGYIPTYMITIDAQYAAEASDADFCALIEHELCHIGVKRDADGNMLVSNMTGMPKHYLRGHDVEEFNTVVERYGASDAVQAMVDLAQQRPTIGKAKIANACGTCLLKLA